MGEKTKMRRMDVVELVNGLRAASRLTAPPMMDNRKFAYAVSRNLVFLVPIVEQAAKLETAFEEERLALNKIHGKKDDKGQYIMTRGSDGIDHYTLADEAAFNGAYKPLKKEFDDDMAADVDVEIHKVAFADIPPGITGDQMHAIRWLVKDPPQE
jgi:hypothetical protein